MAGQPVQPGQGAAAAAQQQPKWPAGGASTAVVSSEQLSLELHQVEREIGKRTREMALVREWDGLKKFCNDCDWEEITITITFTTSCTRVIVVLFNTRIGTYMCNNINRSGTWTCVV